MNVKKNMKYHILGYIYSLKTLACIVSSIQNWPYFGIYCVCHSKLAQLYCVCYEQLVNFGIDGVFLSKITKVWHIFGTYNVGHSKLAKYDNIMQTIYE